MLCPNCGSQQALGSVRCADCGAPFTRREAAKRIGANRAAVAASSARNLRPQQRSGVRRSVVAWLFVMTVVVIAVVALAAFFSSSVVKPYVAKTVGNKVLAPAATAIPTSPPVGSSGSGALATVTGVAGGSHEMVITQQDINNQIAANASAFGPIKNVQVQIADGQFIVTFSAYGMSGRYSGEAVMQDGQPVLANGRVTGSLGMFVSTSTVENALNRQIAAQVAKAGVQVSSVALQPGKMVLTLNS